MDYREIFKEYKENVVELINQCDDKIVVFDLDGVLVEFKYAEDSLLPCRDDKLEDYNKDGNMYEHAHVQKTIKYIIDSIDPENVFILTHSMENVEENKNQFIYDNFPQIKKENIIHVREVTDKNTFLLKIYFEHKKEIIFIEDTATNLLNAEESFEFVTGYHISSLIP